MVITPNTAEAYNLLHRGAQTLIEITHNGICIDVKYCKRKARELEEDNYKRKQMIWKSTDFGKQWIKTYGDTANLDSRQQLNDILFRRLKWERPDIGEVSEDDDEALDKAILQGLIDRGHKDLEHLLKARKIDKIANTYLKNLIVETMDGRLHPNFNLHLVLTYRSSSDTPNFQNMPIRDPFAGEVIRSSFIPRPGHQILEADYSAVEVKIANCYHLDPAMTAYNLDPKTDMHRDVSIDMFKLKGLIQRGIIRNELFKEKPLSKVRNVGKNKFTFPEFYGSFYKQVAASLWNSVLTDGLMVTADLSVKEHLAQLGISTYQSFESHVKEVERILWKERFPVYDQWRRDWYDAYLDSGSFSSLTGFTYSGLMKRTDVINYPVQGSAFHCLLLAAILMHAWLKKHKMKSKIIGQIHDSLVLDVHPSELRVVSQKLNYYMTEVVPKRFSWIMVPLKAEMDVAPVDQPWFKKAPYDFHAA